MPRFDNMAVAALTPGGAQAGVNDIVQAILSAQTMKKAQAAKDEETQWNRGFQEKKLGADISNQLANQGYREREVSATEQRNSNWMQNEAIQNMGAGLDRAGSVGKFFLEGMGFGGRNVAPERTPSSAASRYDDAAIEREVSLEMFGSEKPEVTEDQPIYKLIPGDSLSENPEARETREIPSRGTKKVTRPLKPEESTEYLRRVNERKGQRGASSQIPPAPAGQATPAPQGRTGMGAGITANLGTPQHFGAQPAIDYNAWDAKLQATDPEYRQLRANPQFNWKADIEDGIAKGDYK